MQLAQRDAAVVTLGVGRAAPTLARVAVSDRVEPADFAVDHVRIAVVGAAPGGADTSLAADADRVRENGRDLRHRSLVGYEQGNWSRVRDPQRRGHARGSSGGSRAEPAR